MIWGTTASAHKGQIDEKMERRVVPESEKMIWGTTAGAQKSQIDEKAVAKAATHYKWLHMGVKIEYNYLVLRADWEQAGTADR